VPRAALELTRKEFIVGTMATPASLPTAVAGSMTSPEARGPVKAAYLSY
jgi:hypothetical protein